MLERPGIGSRPSRASWCSIRRAPQPGCSRRSSQIVASISQQATGMSQINQAMKNIDLVAKQNTVATRQATQAAVGEQRAQCDPADVEGNGGAQRDLAAGC